MASGIHSTVRSLHNRLMLRWCPKWYGAFSDPNGGFYERLGKGFKPILTGQRRLVTQCRQLSIYSHAVHSGNKSVQADLRAAFEYIVANYHDPKTGTWYFAMDDDGHVSDTTCDLYALTFVIFSFSHYYRASGDERAQFLSRKAVQFISAHFHLPGQPGYAESVDEELRSVSKLRRQNPHMHLLEACLFAHETWNDTVYERMADDMVSLFYDYFFDDSKGVLREFFADDLSPHPVKGSEVEPGHFFEWVWLLKKHAELKKTPELHDEVALRLLDWANAKGWDEHFGGFYDVLWEEGDVKETSKRIWPFCEAMKANALMLTLAPDRQAIKDRVSAMVSVFEKQYMQERGFWTEWFSRDFAPMTNYMPGTTPYHVYFGITETLSVLEKRGAMKSIGARHDEVLYAVRRNISKLVRKIRDLF